MAATHDTEELILKVILSMAFNLLGSFITDGFSTNGVIERINTK